MCRGGSRAAATYKMECFVIIVNGFQPLTIITKRSVLDVAAALDPTLMCIEGFYPIQVINLFLANPPLNLHAYCFQRVYRENSQLTL